MNHDWQELGTGVYRCRLPFLDVTVGLVHGSAGALLIDCGTTLAEAADIADDVRDLTGGAVTHIVLTHHHFDHILGSGGFPDARLYATTPVAAALTTERAANRREALHYGVPEDEITRALACLRAPDELITQTCIDLGDRSVSVEHPGLGHTDHDLIVVVEAATIAQRRVVFCGDLIEESADPAIGPDSVLAAWPATVDLLLARGGPDALFVPGHGAVVDSEFVARQRDWLTDAAGAP